MCLQKEDNCWIISKITLKALCVLREFMCEIKFIKLDLPVRRRFILISSTQNTLRLTHPPTAIRNNKILEKHCKNFHHYTLKMTTTLAAGNSVISVLHCILLCFNSTWLWIVRARLTNDLSTARPKWRLDGPALSGHLLYSLVNHAYANHHHLVR